MKNKVIVPLIAFSAGALCLHLGLRGNAVGQTPQVQVQTPQVQQRTGIPAVPTVRNMQADDGAVAVTGLLLPDLTVKGMCLVTDTKGWISVRIRLANIGSSDAGPFELGIKYIRGDYERLAVEKIDGLKAGEEKSPEYSHLCCGWSPAESMVETATALQAIADPKYTKTDSRYPGSWWDVKPVIRESNKKNNALTVSKAEIKSCGLPFQRSDRPGLPQPQVPVKPRP